MTDQQFAQIMARLAPADEWMGARAAARYLNVSYRKILTAARTGVLRHEVADQRGRILTKTAWLDQWFTSKAS